MRTLIEIAILASLFLLVLGVLRPPRGPRPRPPRSGGMGVVFFVLSLSLTACASPLEGARGAVVAVVAAYSDTEPRLEERRRADGKACLELAAVGAAETCLVGVRAKWRPIVAAAEQLHKAIISAIALLHTAEAAEALGQRPDVAGVVKVAMDAMVAVDALRSAVMQPAKEKP